MAKVKVIAKDESGKEIPFFTKTLTKEFKGKAGKKYGISIEEPNQSAVFVGDYTVQGAVTPDPHQCQEHEHWDETQQKCVSDDVSHTCPDKQHWDEQQQKCVDDVITTPPTGEVLYDSHIHSKLHDGQVRTIGDAEGAVTPNGLGIEMHASGNPKVVVNADGTFSLICGAGHGRFYGYVLNYDATLEIEAAFWNEAAGQDLSLKMRSRHNEGGPGPNRAGLYGLAVDRKGWGAKREIYHNEHDQSTSGKLPFNIETQKYFTIRFTVKDQGNTVRQIGEMNGQGFMNKVDSSPEPYMVDKALYDKQSYFWVRQNIDSGSGEIRIKRLRILKA